MMTTWKKAILESNALVVLTETPDGLFLQPTEFGPRTDARMNFHRLKPLLGFVVFHFIVTHHFHVIFFSDSVYLMLLAPWLITWLDALYKLRRPLYIFDPGQGCMWRNQVMIGSLPFPDHLKVQSRRSQASYRRYRLIISYPDDPSPIDYVLVETPDYPDNRASNSVFWPVWTMNVRLLPPWEDMTGDDGVGCEWLSVLFTTKREIEDYLSRSRRPGQSQ